MRLRFFLAVLFALLVAGCGPAAPGSEPVPPAVPGVGTAAAAPHSELYPDAPGQVRPDSHTDTLVSATPAAASGSQGGETAPGAPHTGSARTALAPASAEAPKGSAGPRLAILVYHDVEDVDDGEYSITPGLFEAQVRMLKDEGYSFYRLADVERLLAGGKGMPEKGVMLAFDDGYQSFATKVLPIAQKYDVPVVCFMVTKYVDFDIIFGRPHMSAGELKKVAASGLGELAGHSYDGHREAMTEDGTEKPVLLNRIQKPQSTQFETQAEYEARVRGDFAKTAEVLKGVGMTTAARHFTFPYTARSDEAVRLGQQAGFTYFYIGTDQLVRPDTDPTAIPRVNAGAPEISADLLREKLRRLFAEP